ncbi:hypothetical protein K8I31_17550, partial [bacterium]|nr:hypothetical protein [bacterium]
MTPIPSFTPTEVPTETITPELTQTNTPEPTATSIATETPTLQPTVTLTPTITPSPTTQPTNTPVPTQTPTQIPTVTPTPTWTPTPVLIQNPPQLIPNSHPMYEILRYDEASIAIKAFDSNRDAIAFSIEPLEYIYDFQLAADSFFTTSTFKLRTDLEPGEYQITITASDGYYDVKQALRFRIYENQPTSTPAPTATAT